MGTAISKALNGVGGSLGDAFLAPVRAIFGKSCEGVCVGTWDLICFIEHLCLSSIIKLVMVLGLTFLTLLFFYLLFQVGIIQCVIRGFCKMSWAACEAYWSALEGLTCLLWHKLKNTKRVYRGHHLYDLEEANNSSDEDSSASFDDHGSLRAFGSKMSIRERRRDHMRRSLHPVRWRTKSNRCMSGSHHHVRLKTKEVSVHLKSRRRHHSLKKMKNTAFENRMGIRKRRMW